MKWIKSVLTEFLIDIRNNPIRLFLMLSYRSAIIPAIMYGGIEWWILTIVMYLWMAPTYWVGEHRYIMHHAFEAKNLFWKIFLIGVPHLILPQDKTASIAVHLQHHQYSDKFIKIVKKRK